GLQPGPEREAGVGLRRRDVVVAAHAAEALGRERAQHVAAGAERQRPRNVEARAQRLGELDGAPLLHVVEVEVLVARAAVDAGADDALARRRLPLIAVRSDRVLDLDADGTL